MNKTVVRRERDPHGLYGRPRNTDSYDRDLNPVLEAATNVDLEVLHDIIVGRDTNDLTSHKAYKNHHPDHRQYADLIANEIREFGGNTFRNIFRSGGPAYIEVARDVAKYLKVKVSDDDDIETIEAAILSMIIMASLDDMPEETRAAVMAEIGRKELAVAAGPVLAMAVQAVLRAGGFASYKLMLIATNYVVKAAIGRGLAFAANAALTRALGVAIGPVGWAATGAWTIITLGDPAYKVTVPSVIFVAWLRVAQTSVKCDNCGAMTRTGEHCSECGTEFPKHTRQGH